MHALKQPVRLHGRGKSSREAVQLLSISLNTVKRHLATRRRVDAPDWPTRARGIGAPPWPGRQTGRTMKETMVR